MKRSSVEAELARELVNAFQCAYSFGNYGNTKYGTIRATCYQDRDRSLTLTTENGKQAKLTLSDHRLPWCKIASHGNGTFESFSRSERKHLRNLFKAAWNQQVHEENVEAARKIMDTLITDDQKIDRAALEAAKQVQTWVS